MDPEPEDRFCDECGCTLDDGDGDLCEDCLAEEDDRQAEEDDDNDD